MNDKWDEKLFNEFISLRNNWRNAKRNKDYVQIIESCEMILALDERAKFIGIMTPKFYKEIGNAYFKLNEFQNALCSFQIAKEQFINYRRDHNLSNSDDWLTEINSLDKNIRKAKSQAACGIVGTP